MKSMGQWLGLICIGLFAALGGMFVLYSATGLYLEPYSNTSNWILNLNIVILMFVTAWGVFRSAPLIVRCSSTIAIASLVTANLAFSAPMMQVMTRMELCPSENLQRSLFG